MYVYNTYIQLNISIKHYPVVCFMPGIKIKDIRSEFVKLKMPSHWCYPFLGPEGLFLWRRTCFCQKLTLSKKGLTSCICSLIKLQRNYKFHKTGHAEQSPYFYMLWNNLKCTREVKVTRNGFSKKELVTMMLYTWPPIARRDSVETLGWI